MGLVPPTALCHFIPSSGQRQVTCGYGEQIREHEFFIWNFAQLIKLIGSQPSSRIDSQFFLCCSTAGEFCVKSECSGLETFSRFESAWSKSRSEPTWRLCGRWNSSPHSSSNMRRRNSSTHSSSNMTLFCLVLDALILSGPRQSINKQSQIFKIFYSSKTSIRLLKMNSNLIILRTV